MCVCVWYVCGVWCVCQVWGMCVCGVCVEGASVFRAGGVVAVWPPGPRLGALGCEERPRVFWSFRSVLW